MSSTTDALLAEMAGLVRVEKKVKKLTFDDCLPYLLKVYKVMSTNGQKTRDVSIADILSSIDGIGTPKISYKCDDEDDLSRHICRRLWDSKIPADLLFVNHLQTGSSMVTGVVLKLYR